MGYIFKYGGLKWNWVWLCPPIIPAAGRQRWADLREFEPSLLYIHNSRLGRAA